MCKRIESNTSRKYKSEYGEKLDNSKLFNKKESDENVKVGKVEGFDAKKLGEQEITVTFTDVNDRRKRNLRSLLKIVKSQ